MLHKEPLWTRNFILICLAHLSMTVAFYSNMPIMPLFLKERAGAEGLLMGLVVASYTASAIIVRPFIGYFVDRLGRKAVYIPSYLFFGVLFFCYPFAAAILALTALRLAHGVLWGSMMGAANTLAVDLIPARRRGEGIGMFGLTMNLGMALGPALGVVITEGHGYDGLFFASGAMVLGGFILALLVKAPPVPLEKQPFAFRNLLEKTSLPVSLATVFMCIPFGVMTNYMVMYASDELHVSAGPFFLLLAVGMGISRIMAGKTFDRQGPAVAMARGFIILFCAIVLQLSTRHGLPFYVSAFLLGLGYGITSPVCQAMVNILAPAERRGAANATFMTAFDLGICIGLVLIGYVQEHWGWGAAHIIELGCFVLAAVLFWKHCLPHYYRTRAAELAEPDEEV